MAHLLWLLAFACFIHHGQFQSVPKEREAPRSNLLYPHDRQYLLDTINRGQAIKRIPLPFRIPFFGFDMKYIWIHRDGYLLFNKGLLDYPSPVKFPVPHIKDPVREEDPSLIAPWFSRQDIPNSIDLAGVYAQVVHFSLEKNESLKERIRKDFKDAMVGSANFEPSNAVIVTWKNLTHANRSPGVPLKTNTYQAVVATDEIRTYAMFNYDSINWISDKDTYDGVKGVPAFVGFNAGNRTRAFEFEPYSQKPRISRLPSLGFGNGLKGRFYFQINEEILSGSCIERYLDINWSDRPKLTFFPRYGSMLGGTMVNITGPCVYDRESVIKCKFDTVEVDGIYRNPNTISCVSPPVMYHGYVDLSVSIDQGPFLFFGKYYVQPPGMTEADVNVLNEADKLEAPERFAIHWRNEKLTWDTRAPVTISLWGYKETNESYPKLTYIDVLTNKTVLGGDRRLTLDLDAFKNRRNLDKLDIHFGFIAINLTHPEITKNGGRHTPALWSDPLPLGWYFRHQWQRKYGNSWKKNICEDWYLKEKNSERFNTTLPRCPCTLEQAKQDVGRFVPDLQCNEIDRECETFHRPAYHCVTSGRPTIGGGGQSCCYDFHGDLIKNEDTVYSGRPSRAFQFGKHPFKKRMTVPSLSHWVHDASPFFFCCKWTEGDDGTDSCDMFKRSRISDNCPRYQPPGVASAFGESHFLTFDGVNYTFNGKGEFVLTRVNDRLHKFEVQGRFEQPKPRHPNMPKINETRLMAVVARDNLSSVVEFRVRPTEARWQYQLFVIVDNEYVYFPDRNIRVQYFKGVTLYQPSLIYNMSHIVAMFDSGAGMEVTFRKGHMTSRVYLPDTFKNKTRGLLGKWSGRKDDDFTSPDEEVYVTPGASSYQIHHQFGMKYRVSEAMNDKVGRSLFFHDAIPFSEYDDPSFIPKFE